MAEAKRFYYLETILPFKKHKGKTVREVISEDPEYIKWLHKRGVNEPEFNFRLAKMALDMLIQKNEEKHRNDKKKLL